MKPGDLAVVLDLNSSPDELVTCLVLDVWIPRNLSGASDTPRCSVLTSRGSVINVWGTALLSLEGGQDEEVQP